MSEKKNPMEGMPLELVMKLEVRCDALKEYNNMTEDQKAAAERAAREAKTKEETDRIIDSIAKGEYNRFE